MTLHEHADEREQNDFIFICPSYLDCVLAAGDASDIPSLAEWCSELPRKSYGRVFIEIDCPEQMQAFATPPGVGVTWIERADGANGTALMRAVEAWLDEWLRGDPLSGRAVRLWSGARSHPEVAAHWSRIESELADISAAASEYRDQLA